MTAERHDHAIISRDLITTLRHDVSGGVTVLHLAAQLPPVAALRHRCRLGLARRDRRMRLLRLRPCVWLPAKHGDAQRQRLHRWWRPHRSPTDVAVFARRSPWGAPGPGDRTSLQPPATPASSLAGAAAMSGGTPGTTSTSRRQLTTRHIRTAPGCWTASSRRSMS